MLPYAAAVLFLCCAVFRLHEAHGRCNKEVVNKIKALNVPSYPDILDTLDGQYLVIYVDGNDDPPKENDCSRVRFGSEGAKRMVEYDVILSGDQYLLEKKKGTFVHLSHLRTPELTYYPIVNFPEVFAVHVCDDNENEEQEKKIRPGYEPIAMTYIAVRVEKSLLGLSSKINSAKELVKSVGLEVGPGQYGCLKAYPVPQGAAAVGPDTQGKQCYLFRVPYYYMGCEPIEK